MTVFDRIKILSDKQGVSVSKVATDLGFSENLFYQWKTSSPKSDRLAAVADYFHTTTDYLLGRTDDPNRYDEGGHRIPTAAEDFGDLEFNDESESELLAAFRLESEDMTEEEKKKFNDSLKGMMKIAKGLLNDDSKWKE
ncbi:toxin-antitoxin system, antitoxin component, Xre family [Enterococcus faecalis 06-MB-DW-09]|nr:toxin-antitoxin system, antitoxin component, Xre family [Enterococcus faecalis 06-MB-DW-09]